MDVSYFAAALARLRHVRATELGCDETAFDSHSLTVVQKPPGSEGLAMLGLAFGTGTVVSVAAEYLSWVHQHAPERHYRVLDSFSSVFVQPFIDEAARRGETLSLRSSNLAFVASAAPVARPIPPGFRLQVIDAAWRAEQLPTNTFHNALWEPGEDADQRWTFGVALMDGSEIAAVAGACDDGQGILEIGVDVARAYRGRGLAINIVTAIAAAIHGRGAVPTYYCAPTNILSHRTALACGFIPVSSATRVARSRSI